MMLFFVVGLLCFLAIPVVATYFASSALLGPAHWMVQTLRLRNRGRQQLLLAAPGRTALAPYASAPARRRLDSGALARRSVGATYFEGTVGVHRVLLRTQPRAVDRAGQPVGLPLGREQRRECQYVSAAWLMIDLQDILPENLSLHVQWSPGEDVLGDEGLAAALLDGRLQAVLRTGDQFVISDGALGVDSPFAIRDRRLVTLLEELSRCAGRLASHTVDGRVDVRALLAEAATTYEGTPASQAHARARATELYLSRFGPSADADDLRGRALEDEAPEVRFAAARHLPPEAAFEPVQRIVFDPNAREGLRQRALRYLLRTTPLARSRAVMQTLVTEGPERLRQIAVRHATATALTDAVPWLLEAASSPEPQTLTDVADALGALADVTAEPPLLRMLRRPERSVQLAAAEALGNLGSLDAVVPLMHLQENGTPELRLVAQSAIHAIRSRSTRTGAGSLSLAAEPDTQGALSVSGGSEGALSAAPEEA